MNQKIQSSVIIGSGFSGLAMAIELKKKGIHDFIILEKAEDLGGTWRENTYPGAECDIPSALYSYSFEPYPFWEYKWSLQPQILEYIHFVVKKYDLLQHIIFQKEMMAAQWNQLESYWEISTQESDIYYSKTLVSAIGQLHHPSIPDFKGKELFKNPSWHSAQWNHDISLKGKKVGVIGNAASAIQLIPEIAKEVDQLFVFQRSANWIVPKQDRAYKAWEKKLVKQFPFLLKLYRLNIWMKSGVLFFTLKKGNHLLRKCVEWYAKRYIKKHIKDSDTVHQLIPDYPLGAKRLLFSDHYYKAIARSNVQVITGGVQEITENGIISGNGIQQDLDVLIYATGFKTNPFLMGIDLNGRNGIRIQEHWKKNTASYFGITTDQFPNFFMMYGPNTNLGHNSIILMAEAQANYIGQCVKKIKTQSIKSIEIKSSILDKHYHEIQSRLKNMIWSAVDNSWYKTASGDIANNFPGRTMEYIRKTKNVDFEDYTIEK